MSTSVAGNKPQRIRRIQTVTLVLLFMAGIVNFLDRSSLSVAGEAIRGELGLSATEFGVLLSAFSLSYGFSQLPSGILLDRFGPRIVLGAGLIFWSLMQALTGMVNSFSHFILMRIGLGIGEAPFMPAGVKSITDWYAQKERGTALGIFNSSTVIGQAIAPPALVLMQLAWGWRTMFVIIGVAGILVGICWYAWYRNRAQFVLTDEERTYLSAPVKPRPQLQFSEWLALFKHRTTWGMILGFSGVNYTGWLYIAWLPGYLQAEQGFSLAKTGWVFDNQGTQLAQGIYNATIAGVHKFDCKNYTFDNSISSFASDTLPTLYGVEPFLSYRKDDTILTFAYVKHDVENGDPSSLKLVQPKLYNPEAKTDTLFLIYEKGNIKDSKSSDYISFKLPQYPSDTDINVVVRYNAESSNLSTNNGDRTSKLFSITYNRPSTLN